MLFQKEQKQEQKEQKQEQPQQQQQKARLMLCPYRRANVLLRFVRTSPTFLLRSLWASSVFEKH